MISAWNAYRALVLDRMEGVISALELFMKNIVDGEGIHEGALKDQLFDLSHLIGAVTFTRVLRTYLRSPANNTGLTERASRDMFRAFEKNDADIRAILFPFIHPDHHDGKYLHRLPPGQESGLQELAAASIEAAGEHLKQSAERYARMQLPHLLRTETEASTSCYESGYYSFDAIAPGDAYTSEHASSWSSCSALATTTMAAASATSLINCAGV